MTLDVLAGVILTVKSVNGVAVAAAKDGVLNPVNCVY